MDSWPPQNTHASMWSLRRKQGRAGVKEMPLSFHLCNAKGLPQVLQSNSACCKRDALRSHEDRSDCLHTSTMFWDHLLQPQPQHSMEQLNIHFLGLLDRAGSTKLALAICRIWNNFFLHFTMHILRITLTPSLHVQKN